MEVQFRKGQFQTILIILQTREERSIQLLCIEQVHHFSNNLAILSKDLVISNKCHHYQDINKQDHHLEINHLALITNLFNHYHCSQISQWILTTYNTRKHHSSIACLSIIKFLLTLTQWLTVTFHHNYIKYQFINNKSNGYSSLSHYSKIRVKCFVTI